AAHVEMEGAPPAVLVNFDPRRLSRVFFNLIHNATDAMPNGGLIFLRFHANDREIVTEIEDTGMGISPEIADQLFQPFATHGKTKGTGLGLSICKKIVEDYGGAIAARSGSQGAIFSFSLPLAK
ncbi:MAG TPA: HAMP domain-containing sensor histidine kinase, partial [Verrucomicrobiae bacterium]